MVLVILSAVSAMWYSSSAMSQPTGRHNQRGADNPNRHIRNLDATARWNSRASSPIPAPTIPPPGR
jgi:hypothetical protein